MADLRDLIERVEKLDEPSREVDAEIDATLFGGRASHTFTEDHGGARLRKSYDPGTVFLHPDPLHNGGHVLTSHYRAAAEATSSLDAAIALCERVLPGWSYMVLRHYESDGRPFGVARVSRVKGDTVEGYDAVHDHKAIALVLATLRAVAKEGRT